MIAHAVDDQRPIDFDVFYCKTGLSPCHVLFVSQIKNNSTVEYDVGDLILFPIVLYGNSHKTGELAAGDRGLHIVSCEALQCIAGTPMIRITMNSAISSILLRACKRAALNVDRSVALNQRNTTFFVSGSGGANRPALERKRSIF